MAGRGHLLYGYLLAVNFTAKIILQENHAVVVPIYSSAGAAVRKSDDLLKLQQHVLLT